MPQISQRDADQNHFSCESEEIAKIARITGIAKIEKQNLRLPRETREDREQGAGKKQNQEQSKLSHRFRRETQIKLELPEPPKLPKLKCRNLTTDYTV